jgi:hypothetical protein
MDLQKVAESEVKVSTTDKAYAAGFVDAEGTFVLSPVKGEYCRLCIYVYGNDLEQLQDVQQIIGGRLRPVKRKKRSEKHADSFTLSIENIEGVRHACLMLKDYLVLKKEQAQILLTACDQSSKERFVSRERLKEINSKGQQRSEFRNVVERCMFNHVTSEEWAYLAGWVDGDGNLSFQPQKFRRIKYWYPWVKVYSTKLEPLVYLQSIFGGVVKTRNKRDAWSLEGSILWQGQQMTEPLLLGLLPYLRQNKQKAEILLESLAYPSTERQIFVEMMQDL